MTTLLIWNRANPFESSQKSPTIYRVFFLHLSWFNSPTPGIFNLITSWSSNNKAALLPPNSVRTFQHRKDVGTSQNIPRICRKLTKPNQIHSKKNKILPFKMWPVFFATTESPLENKGGSVRLGLSWPPLNNHLQQLTRIRSSMSSLPLLRSFDLHEWNQWSSPQVSGGFLFGRLQWIPGNSAGDPLLGWLRLSDPF